VLGADGFGFANDGGTWVKVPQLGGVVVGNDVEIGANSCIDRGSLRDTVVADGVKIDNLVQVAHNVEIGKHTAIAACSGIAGSTKIGQYCNLGGASGVLGHLEIADGVTVTAKSLVTRSLKQAGAYSSNIPAGPNKKWLKNSVHFRHMDEWVQRIKNLEAKLVKKT
jgi:UDP-3-O-[3-hydroxymyristoyl] glucosamine N-acyltransferase